MSTSAVCPKCGFANQPGYQFCTNCGGPLVPGAVAPPPYGVPPAYTVSPWEYERRRAIDRTKTGVLLLLIGSLLSWVLVVGIIGELLLLIGAILVILGRRAFGPSHSRNVVLSIVLFFLGIGISFLGAFVLALSAAPELVSGELVATTNALRSLFANVLVVIVIGGVVTGLASVLFTYALQKPTGRMLLWAGYAATIAGQIAILVLLAPEIDGIADVVAREIVTRPNDPTAIASATASLTDRIGSFFYLSAIPAILFAIADYLVWDRINRGEIPAPSAAPVAPPSTAPPIQPE